MGYLFKIYLSLLFLNYIYLFSKYIIILIFVLASNKVQWIQQVCWIHSTWFDAN